MFAVVVSALPLDCCASSSFVCFVRFYDAYGTLSGCLKLAWLPPFWERAVQQTTRVELVPFLHVSVFLSLILLLGIWNLIVSVPDHCPFTLTL